MSDAGRPERDTLLRDGETVEQWWAEHGMNVEARRAERSARYAEQRAATLNGCRAIAARVAIHAG